MSKNLIENNRRWKAKEKRKGIRRVQIPLDVAVLQAIDQAAAGLSQEKGIAQRRGAAIGMMVNLWQSYQNSL